ncbi:acyl- N-acyltransferase [Pyrrhoderma noxium]|uniref:Glucosamine 6-phosphate N-acetyltransferase n=1 Tax=Pyrrhoderma noxium TaxID=2282107 RepID=A0A286UEL8_9AGAM|nr:acyl- N-acyltransferase [Pyrrhoderma noxium]
MNAVLSSPRRRERAARRCGPGHRQRRRQTPFFISHRTPRMPLTQDSELDLLFPADRIPQEVKDALHEDLHIRPLASTDYRRGHLDVLSVLTVVTDPGEEAWVDQFRAQQAAPDTYYTIVVLERSTDRIVGVGCVFIERKFLRGLGKVGHIEDIAVDSRVQGKKIGLRIIDALTRISESAGCYKTILNCSDKNIPFYVKCGYEKKENEMAKYAKKDIPPPSPTTSRL